MKTNNEIRLDNLIIAINRIGTSKALADLADCSAQYLSQIKNRTPESKTGKPKTMGDELARKIERAIGEPVGWMDTPQDMNTPSITLTNTLARHGSHKTASDVEIPQYEEVGDAAGSGVLLRDQPGEIHGWRVTPDWIAKNVKSHSGVGNLAIVTGFGDSMRGMFNPGDPLLVDRGITTVDFDGVYFFRVGEEGFIKRLQRVPGEGLVAISENKAYRDWVVKPDMDFEVFARVIKVWIGTDF